MFSVPGTMLDSRVNKNQYSHSGVGERRVPPSIGAVGEVLMEQ